MADDIEILLGGLDTFKQAIELKLLEARALCYSNKNLIGIETLLKKANIISPTYITDHPSDVADTLINPIQ